MHSALCTDDRETYDPVVKVLLTAGANPGGNRELRDMHGDTPLSWASWYRRPASVLRLLTFGAHSIHPRYRGMRANLIGDPLPAPR